MRLSSRTTTTLLVALLLGLWVFWLRWPSFDRPAWNLDEGIHATIARSILDGGVMYRDAIDQRTPLTYYLVAGCFWLCGENNMWAVHALLAGMITATALGIFLIGRRWRGPATGGWAALIFCACTTNLFYIGDSYSLSTEWFVIFFTTWSTWWLWRTWAQNSLGLAALGGAGFAAAFLSKQPGLLDFGAPLATVIYALATGQLRGAETSRRLIGLCAGFTGFTALVFSYFWAHGALDDLYFYAWSYNLTYYGPETTAGDRLTAAVELIVIIWRQYPVICAALLITGPMLLRQLVQKQPTAEERQRNVVIFYLLIWALLAGSGASSAGRIYGHYYLQCLPALSLLVGWLLADSQACCFGRAGRIKKSVTGLVLAAAAWTVVAGPLRGPWPSTLGLESSIEPANYVRAHSQPDDKIFIWGYNPDFYLYADRRPASRYIYCSFLTGMIPWTNTAPDRDTRYAIVPGTLEILLQDLTANRPEFFIDSSLGDGRLFRKYPLAKFPPLAAFVSTHYVEVESWRFRPHGFRMLVLKDAAHRGLRPLAGGAPTGQLADPIVVGPLTTEPVPVEFEVRGEHSTGRLQRLELLIDEKIAETYTFDAVSAMTVTFTAHFEKIGRGRHTIAARATTTTGEIRTGPTWVVSCSPESLPAEQRAAFALTVATAGLPPEKIISSFGASAQQEGDAMIYFAHAPSMLSYAVPPKAVRLSGRFGFRAGAYANANSGHTDGAEFSITLINPHGQRTELLRRLLKPWAVAEDRGEQPFSLVLPRHAAGGTLELNITSGPANNSASDWTYWADLQLKISP